MSLTRPRSGPRRALATAVVAAGVTALAGAALAQAYPSSIPTTAPSDAKLAKLTVQSSVIKSFKVTNKGDSGYATVTLTPPAGKQVLQGFATLTGGNTSSSIIRSTQVVGNSKYVVKLFFPGENGTPGVLHAQLQLLPRP